MTVESTWSDADLSEQDFEDLEAFRADPGVIVPSAEAAGSWGGAAAQDMLDRLTAALEKSEEGH